MRCVADNVAMSLNTVKSIPSTTHNNFVLLVMQTFTLAGFCAGVTEAIIINPFEVVKVQLQAERGKFVQVKFSFVQLNVTSFSYGTKELTNRVYYYYVIYMNLNLSVCLSVYHFFVPYSWPQFWVDLYKPEIWTKFGMLHPYNLPMVMGPLASAACAHRLALHVPLQITANRNHLTSGVQKTAPAAERKFGGSQMQRTLCEKRALQARGVIECHKHVV